MRNRYLVTVGVTAAMALGAIACNNDKITNLNRNPNNPLTAPSGPVFTQAVRLAVSRWLGTGYDLRGTEFVAQHLAESQYPDDDAYARLQGSSTTGTFDGAYGQELEDFQQVIKGGEAQNAPRIWAPALIMRSWVFGYLTDTWGDIPYFSALQGDSSAAVLSPTYDAQKDIYADFFVQLKKANDVLKGTPTNTTGLGTADLIYSGNVTRWRRFANSLRARHAMRLANVDPTTARNEFLAAFNDSLMQSNADNALLQWPGDGVYDNPWSVNFRSRDDHRVSDRLLRVMGPLNDPRVPIWAIRAEVNDTSALIFKYCPDATRPCYVGLQNALTQATAAPLGAMTSRPGLIFWPASSTAGIQGQGARTPSYLMTFAEVSLLKAEAAERGWIPGSAAQFYQEGIRASMEQWGVASSAITTYLAQPSVVYAGGTPGQIQIATQKWLALFTDGGQAWAEWRRTCQPTVVKPGPSAIINQVPRRFQYSVTETQVNKTGVDAALARQGPDEFLTRMYWDKSPATAPTYPGASCGTR